MQIDNNRPEKFRKSRVSLPTPQPEENVRRRPRQRRVPGAPVLHDVFKTSVPQDIWSGTSFRGGPIPKRKSYQLALWSLLAALIDGLILISLCCFSLICLSWLQKQLGLPAPSLTVMLSLFLLFTWSYMVILRVWMGFTIGEWACDLRLGQPQERFHWKYPFTVMLRETVILLTGFVLLPLLSLLLGQDIAGRLTGGLYLFSLK